MFEIQTQCKIFANQNTLQNMTPEQRKFGSNILNPIEEKPIDLHSLHCNPPDLHDLEH